jgi:SSS family solute:Na+ symporter
MRLNVDKAAAVQAHNLAVLAASGGKVEDLQGLVLSGSDVAILGQRLGQIKGLTKHELQGFKYDASLNLLIKNLLPEGSGLRGFVIAALLGAIVSSLAAILNAASTIFTMDVYQRYMARQASQAALVKAGRISVGVFAVIGCLMSPNLDKFGSIFKYIQMFQGYASPGILAVFVFGIMNRRGPGFCGVVGLLLNPVLYFCLDKFTGLAFLDSMAVCFFSVLLVMWLIALAKPLPQPIEFQLNSRLDLTASTGARNAGIVVILAAVVLYVIFSPLGIAE